MSLFSADGTSMPSKINPTQLPNIQCSADDCTNDIFMPALKIKKVSGLLTGTGNDEYIPIQVMMCTSCGTLLKEFDV